jgi:hypothetical protein
MIEKNLKKIVKSKKLSNDEMDDMLRRMLYKKLCLEQQKPKKVKPIKKKKGKKFKLAPPPSSSESESESE